MAVGEALLLSIPPQGEAAQTKHEETGVDASGEAKGCKRERCEVRYVFSMDTADTGQCR